jgi:hypothetical protein
VIGACVFVGIAMMSSFDFGRFVPGPLIVLAVIWIVAFHRKGRRISRGQWTGGNGTGANGTDGSWTGQGWSGPATFTGPQDAPQPGPQDASPAGQQPTSPAAGQSAPGVAAYTTPQTGPSAPPAGLSSSATQRPQDRTVEPVQPVWTEDDPLGLYVDEPPAVPPATTGPSAQPPAKGMRGVKSVIVLLTGIAIAIAWAAGAATSTMLVIGVATLGAGMLLGGFLGRTLALLPLGILLAAGAVASTVFPSIPRNFADINYIAPANQQITATSTTYAFDAGSVHLDLTKATFVPGARVDVHGGAGEIVIKLPQDVDVQGQLSARAGDLTALTEHKGGHNAELTLNDLGADGKAGPSTVTLDLDVKLGSIRVERG